MTGSHPRSPDQHHDDDSATDPRHHFTALADIAGLGDLVPIVVWRLDDDGDGFASQLARRLVLTYTRHGETLVDLDADPDLRDAATAVSRTYLAIAQPGDVADLDTITDPVSLVVVRWPRQSPTSTPTADSIADLFTACRLIMNTDTCAIAAVSSAARGEPGLVYAEHFAHLLPAARAAGLTHALVIVAVTGEGSGDQFLYYATRAEADAARSHDGTIPDGPAHHIDLLVFITNDGRRD